MLSGTSIIFTINIKIIYYLCGEIIPALSDIEVLGHQSMLATWHFYLTSDSCINFFKYQPLTK